LKYLPLSEKDKREMLDFLGVDDIDDLFTSIPEKLRLSGDLDIPRAQSEMEVRKYFDGLAQANQSFASSFLGGGVYSHFYPVMIDYLSSRQEFLTSYTPYQPEISQGTLQYLFEFQTMMTDLTGLEISNASMYDGATATAEAILMASRINKRRRRVLLSQGVHPNYRTVIQTYLANLDIDLEFLPLRGDRTDVGDLGATLGDDVIAVVVGYPNFYGVVEPVSEIAKQAQDAGALVITSTAEALSLALLASPGSMGVHIAVGEAQSFGVPPHFGGPHLGFFCCQDKNKRQLPGRVVGQTVDRNGKRAFVLTLSAREQHIRRAKATSNICSNEGLCALRATIFLAAMGKNGLREMALQNHAKMEYLKNQLSSIEGVEVAPGPHFNEFVVHLPRPANQIVENLTQKGINPGLDLGRFEASRKQDLLVAVTECNSKDEMDTFTRVMEQAL